MYNIYEKLREIPDKSYIISDELQAFIIHSFTLFFNRSLNLKESTTDLSFEYVDANLGNNTSFNYRFKYGYLSLSIGENNLFVNFHLYNSAIQKLNSPLESNTFVVYIDTNMNYKYAEFNRNFDLRYNMKSCANLKVSHLVFPDRIENTLVSNLFDGNDTRATFTSKNYLSPRYFGMKQEFRDCFTKFLIACDYNSTVFTEVFSDYAAIIKSINAHSSIIDILNKFEKDYSDNLDNLDAKMLVCNMNLI